MFPKFLRIASQAVQSQQSDENEVTENKTANDVLLRHIDAIAKYLGFSSEIVFPSDENSIGWFDENGSWTGVLGMIQRHEADMTLGEVALIEETLNDFHLSYPLDSLEITFMTRKHEYVPNDAIFLHPFSIQVWISIIACLFIIPFAFRLVMRKKHSPLKNFMSTFRSLVGQGIELEPHLPSEYLLLTFWIFSSALLSYFYSAVLLSFVTFPSLQGISTIEDLANGIKEDKYHCSTYSGVIYGKILARSTDSSMQIIGEKMEQNSKNGTKEIIDVLETFSDNKKPVFIGIRKYLLPFKEVYFISEDNFFFLSGTFALHKDFCCKAELDEAVHRFWASGIYENLDRELNLRDFFYNKRKHGAGWHKQPSESKLTMSLFKGPFLFLAVFLALAFLLFCMEIYVGKLKKKRKFLKIKAQSAVLMN